MRLTMTMVLTSLLAVAPAMAEERSRAADRPAEVPAATEDPMAHAQQAYLAVNDAQAALAARDRDKALESLERAQTQLQPLYDTPLLSAVMNELDETLRLARGERAVTQPLDLAPLVGVVREQRSYLTPEAYAEITKAEKAARDKDASAAAEHLRLARERLNAEIAFLPVEEAYVRVVAARTMIQGGQMDAARRLLASLPIFVGDVRVTAPLVPVRFALQAAAAAAEEKNWTRAATLLHTARTRLDGVVQSAPQELSRDLAPIRAEIDRLEKQVVSGAGARPQPARIRGVARRVSDVSAG